MNQLINTNEYDQSFAVKYNRTSSIFINFPYARIIFALLLSLNATESESGKFDSEIENGWGEVVKMKSMV